VTVIVPIKNKSRHAPGARARDQSMELQQYSYRHRDGITIDRGLLWLAGHGLD